MSQQLGPLEIECDAPPYPIVKACNQIGIQSPEDVRWLRLSRLIMPGPEGAGSLFTPWQMLWKPQMPQREYTCTCGQPLPMLHRVMFSAISGNEFTYLLGQCRRCRTVFWDDV